MGMTLAMTMVPTDSLMMVQVHYNRNHLSESDKKYTCEVCNKKWNYLEDLRQHKRMHKLVRTAHEIFESHMHVCASPCAHVC